MAICPVCAGASENGVPFDGGMRTPISCPGCGDFIITNSAEKVLKDQANKVAVISHWIRRSCDAGQKPEIDQSKVLKILAGC